MKKNKIIHLALMVFALIGGTFVEIIHAKPPQQKSEARGADCPACPSCPAKRYKSGYEKYNGKGCHGKKDSVCGRKKQFDKKATTPSYKQPTSFEDTTSSEELVEDVMVVEDID